MTEDTNVTRSTYRQLFVGGTFLPLRKHLFRFLSLGSIWNRNSRKSAAVESLGSMTSSTEGSSLWEIIKEGLFYSLSDEAILRLIKDAFEPELERLKNAYSMQEPGSPTHRTSPDSDSKQYPSQILYGKIYDEINRTSVGILALRWLMNDDYDTFVRGQPLEVRLQRDSFDWLRKLFTTGLQTPDDLFALVTATITNDLGKDSNLERDVLKLTGQSEMNHDMVLLEAAKAGMVPSLERLDQPYKDDLMLGLELGSELNAGQLAQAENVIGSLEGLLAMRGHERAFELKFMEQLLDVAGAAGHSDPSCAKRMIEPVFQGFKTVYKVALDIISGRSSLRQGYDTVLKRRGSMLQHTGFRMLSVDVPEERALLRLLTMGRTANYTQAELFYDTFHSLPASIRQELVDGLNVDGHKDGTAVLPYYMPAMLSEGLENVRNSSDKLKKDALSSLMRFLARVLEGTKPQPGVDGVVIERNLMYAQSTIASAEFRDDPRVLDKLEIPKGEVLRRRRTSASSTATAKDASTRPFENGGLLHRQDSIQEEK